MREIFIKSIPQLFENIKNELLSFSILALIFITTFPESKLVVFFVWSLTFSVYSIIKLKFLFTEEKNILKLFEKYLDNPANWEKRFEGDREYWIYKDDPIFQIEAGEDLVRDFKESWMRHYPDMDHNYSFKVYLKYLNTVIHDFAFVALDGVRYIVPLPERENGKYYYEVASLKTKVTKIIGQYYLYDNFEEFALGHKIEFR